MTLRRLTGHMLGLGIAAVGSVQAALLSLDRGQMIVCAYGHKPSRSTFEKLVVWLLGNGFCFVSDTDVLSALDAKKCLPNRSIWLSFDDGLRDNLVSVVPVLQKYQIPATFFICPEAAETGWLWFQVARKYASLLPGSDYRLLCSMPNDQRRDIAADIMRTHHIVPGRSTMTPDEIASLARSALVSIQNHTNSHAILSCCSETESFREISTASQRILDWTGRRPIVLSYPRGESLAESATILERAGLAMAVTCEPQFVNLNGVYDRCSLPRTAFANEGSLRENICQVFGVWQPVVNRIKRTLHA